GEDCTIEGTSRSVNGSVKVGNRSSVEDLTVVNGSIRTGEGVSVDGNVESVNGTIELGNGSGVSGEVSTVNGSIVLNQTVVQRDVLTMHGDIELRDKSVVKGDIVIGGKIGVIETENKTSVVKVEDNVGVIVIDDKKRDSNRPIEIEVTGGSIIEGNVMVKRNVEVRLILSDGGKVLGQVDGAEVIDKGEAQPALDSD
ncbi:MAG: hypothetical protein OES90_12200, partial [Xanthomonadales bacterium]|nr:hypothetical protein [Xanthomonadales bacterium]